MVTGWAWAPGFGRELAPGGLVAGRDDADATCEQQPGSTAQSSVSGIVYLSRLTHSEVVPVRLPCKLIRRTEGSG
jgi:hypothetical protein